MFLTQAPIITVNILTVDVRLESKTHKNLIGISAYNLLMYDTTIECIFYKKN